MSSPNGVWNERVEFDCLTVRWMIQTFGGLLHSIVVGWNAIVVRGGIGVA